MQITIKLAFEDEIRRVTIGDTAGELAFAHLRSSVDELFPSLRNREFRVMWKDEDGDLVTITSDAEFMEAIRELKAAVPKFYVKTIPKESVAEPQPSAVPVAASTAPAAAPNLAVHENVCCDECGKVPIVGDRFSCTVRPDYDLCATCEAKKTQPFPMVKHSIPVPAFSRPGGPPGLHWRGNRWGMRRHVNLGEPAPPQQGVHGCSWRDHVARRMNRDATATPHAATGPSAPAVAPSAFIAAMDADAAARAAGTVGGAVDGRPVHTGVSCDGCGVSPIVGARYKCSVRPNYDLCEACEAAQARQPAVQRGPGAPLRCGRPFPMLKIARPDQAPGTFVYLFNKHSADFLGGGRGMGFGMGMGGRGGMRRCGTGSEEAVHRHVTCDVCKMHPLVGPRFKCAVRPDFDLCAACEETTEQPFPLVKIYHPAHRPSTVVYCAAPAAAAASASVSASEPRAVEAGPVKHSGVRCDSCGVFPIMGVRYKCTTRGDYDMCAACERAAVPPYPLVKICNPAQAPTALRYEVDGAAARPIVVAAAQEVHRGVSCDSCGVMPIRGPRFKCTVRGDFDLCSACEARGPQPYPMVKIYADAHHPSKLVYAFRAFLAAANATAAASPSPAPVPAVAHVATPSAVAALPKPSLRFVRDRSLPDGYLVVPGSPDLSAQGTLRKVWDVRNDGHHTWPSGCRLTFASGDVLHVGGGQGSTAVGDPVPLLQPGEEGQLAVELIVPSQAGRYTSYFRMQTAAGQPFGQRLWADFVVSDAYAAAVEQKRTEEEEVRDFEAFLEQHLHPDPEAAMAAGAVELGAALAACLRGDAAPSSLSPVPEGDGDADADEQGVEAGAVGNAAPAPVKAVAEAEETRAEEDAENAAVSPAPAVASLDAMDALSADVVAEAEAAVATAEDCDWEVVAKNPSSSAAAPAAVLSPATVVRQSLVEVEEEDSDSDESECSAGLHEPLSLSINPAAGDRDSADGSAPSAVAMTLSAVHPLAQSHASTLAHSTSVCADLDFDEAEDLQSALTSPSPRPHPAAEPAAAPAAAQELGQEFCTAGEESKTAEPSVEQDGVGDGEGDGDGDSVPSPVEAACRKRWHRELRMLAEMGFGDPAVCVPLLEEHVRTPACEDSAAAAQTGLNTEGLHAVLTALLGL